ncbi:hypothetical protein Sjap_012110 [Stephania japonica]|uniref:Protein kinase domain-containing protein n=1 Tax=Stephania japonica TaxID=461633 RepID=A0AAP0IX36_9MAGN
MNQSEDVKEICLRIYSTYNQVGRRPLLLIKREVEILKQLRHPNIVRLHEVLASKTKIYLVLEYVSGDELYYKIEKGRLLEVNSRKLENILFTPTRAIKISDFGLPASPYHFKGPLAASVLQHLTKEDLSKLYFGHFKMIDTNGAHCFLIRTGFFTDLINSFGSYTNDLDKMALEVLRYVFYFLVTGEQQSTKMSIKFLETALNQDVRFFDTEVRTSDVVFAINTDVVLVQDAISETIEERGEAF